MDSIFDWNYGRCFRKDIWAADKGNSFNDIKDFFSNDESFDDAWDHREDLGDRHHRNHRCLRHFNNLNDGVDPASRRIDAAILD